MRVLAVSAMAIAAALLAPSPAAATPTTEVVQGQVLRLVSTADWAAAASLHPGHTVQWDVAVSADAPEPGTVHIGVSATGDAALVLDVMLCTREWVPSGCPAGEAVLHRAWDIPRDGNEIHLADIVDTEVAHIRLAIALAEGDAWGTTHVRVHAQGAGESAVVGPGGGLASTGMSPVAPWLFGGTVLLVLGGVLLAARRRNRQGNTDGGGT